MDRRGRQNAPDSSFTGPEKLPVSTWPLENLRASRRKDRIDTRNQPGAS